MKAIDVEVLPELLAAHGVTRRLVRELKLNFDDYDWNEHEFAVVYNRQKSAGVLIFDSVPLEFTITKRKAGTSGRIEPIICDLCRTWRRGSESAMISFKRGGGSVTHLCCATLDCSANVRMQTKAAILSKTQLREQVTPERRIERLVENLQQITHDRAS